MAITGTVGGLIEFSTAGDSVTATAGMKIHAFKWCGPSNGHTLHVKDQSGNTIFRAIASKDNELCWHSFAIEPFWCNGINVSTMSSGLFSVYTCKT